MVYEYETGKKVEDTTGHSGKRNAVIYTRDKQDEDSVPKGHVNKRRVQAGVAQKRGVLEPINK